MSLTVQWPFLSNPQAGFVVVWVVIVWFRRWLRLPLAPRCQSGGVAVPTAMRRRRIV
jgi:hypothetical protein